MSRRAWYSTALSIGAGADCGCAGAADVARALEFAQKQNLPLAVRGGGHNRAGFSVCDGGMVIDLSGMNRVQVDAGKRVARAESGALVRDLDHATQRFGLATTSGGCPTVGIAGLTLGGGEGQLMAKYGAACDNLISAQIVTVDGRQVEASQNANPDLFWAIRGGGGNSQARTTACSKARWAKSHRPVAPSESLTSRCSVFEMASMFHST
jgi:FAD/FMN-containing dehydrogenase